MAWSLGHTMIVLLALLLGAVVGWLSRGARAGDASTNAAASGWASRDTDRPAPDTAAGLPTQRDASQTDDGRAAPSAEDTTPAATVAAAEGGPREVGPAQDVTVAAGDHAATAVVDQAPPAAVEDEPDAPARDTAVTHAPVTDTAARDTPVTDAETVAATAAPESPVPGAGDTTAAADDQGAALPTTPVPVADAPAATTEATTVPVTETSVPVTETSVPVAETTPETTTAPVTDTPAGADDDLRRIEGIGPKMATALSGAGIRTYRQLAGTDVEALRTAVRAAGMRAPASLPTWPQQAAMFAGSAETAAAYPGPGPDEAGV